MARPLRIEYPGAVYHVMSRGDSCESIAHDDSDRELFLSVLTTAIERHNLLIHGYCLMENHYHLLAETPDGNLAECMHLVNGMYTQAFNRAHKRVGHVYQGRYKAILVQKEEYLLALIRYIERNPIRAGLVERPEHWAWSSYRFTAGHVREPQIPMHADWVLSQFAGDRRKAQILYRDFVLKKDTNEEPLKKVVGQSILGNDAFVARFFDVLERKQKIEEIPRKQRYQGRPPLHLLFDADTTQECGLRNAMIEEAIYEYGYSQREVAEHLGLHYSSISKAMRKVSGGRSAC